MLILIFSFILILLLSFIPRLILSFIFICPHPHPPLSPSTFILTHLHPHPSASLLICPHPSSILICPYPHPSSSPSIIHAHAHLCPCSFIFLLWSPTLTSNYSCLGFTTFPPINRQHQKTTQHRHRIDATLTQQLPTPHDNITSSPRLLLLTRRFPTATKPLTALH